ncbi:MAG: O-antigen ligase family protein [Chloroflexota bacterium]|nr:O-antigen ligase family protein [Chloroflexota bacterium]
MEFCLVENRSRSLLIVLALGIALALAGGAVIAFGSPAIAFAIVLAVVASAIVLSNIEFGVYAVIAVAVLLPFGALPLNIGFNPTFLDLALLALFAMWVARGLTRQGFKTLSEANGGGFVATPLGLPILVFLVLAVFSFVAGLAYAPLDREVVRHFAEVLISIALFFVIVNVVQTRAVLGRFVTALLLAGFISAAIGIILYFIPSNLSIQILSALRVFKYPTGDGVLRFIEDDPANPMRAISTSIDPNVLGGLMILVTALAVPQLFASKPLLPRPLIAAMVVTMGVCMVLTFSRGAMLGLGLALVVIATVRYRPIIAVMILGAAVFLLLPFTQDYVGHFLDAFAGSDRATQMRLGEYKDALNLISRYPIFGVGFGGSPDIDTYLGVSSVYLLMAEEMGLVGLAAFLVTMALFFFHAAQAWFTRLVRDEFLAPILLGVAGALLGAMIGGLTDHYFFNLAFPHSVALFWLYAGLGMATVRLGTPGESQSVDNPHALP